MNVRRKTNFLFCFALYKEMSLTKRKQQETGGKGKKELLEGNTAKQFWSLDTFSTKWMTW